MAPGRRSGKWSRTARRGPIAALTARSCRGRPCTQTGRVPMWSSCTGLRSSRKIPGAVPLSPAGGLHGLAAGAARPRQGGIVHVDRFEDYVRDIACFLRDIVPERRCCSATPWAAAWPRAFCRSGRTVLHAPFCARPCSARRRAARRTGWRSAVRACCCGRASGRKARCFPALMIPTPNFRAAAARAAPVSAPPWTAAQSVLPIRRWARRNRWVYESLALRSRVSARAPAAGCRSPVLVCSAGRDTQVSLREQRLLAARACRRAAAGIPRRKARAVQRRKCRIGGIPGCGSGFFRPDGRIRKGRDKMTLLIVVDMQNDFVTGALGTAGGAGDRAACECEDRSGGCRRLYTRHPRRGLPCHAGGARGCPCRTASAAPGATRWPTA